MSFSRMTGCLLGFLALILVSMTGHEPQNDAKAATLLETEETVISDSVAVVSSASSSQNLDVPNDLLEELATLTDEWSELPVDQVATRLNYMPLALDALEVQLRDMEGAVEALEYPEGVENWNTPAFRMLLVGIGDWQGMYDEDIRKELKKGPQDLPLTDMLIEARMQVDAHRRERLLKQFEKVHLEARLRQSTD